MTNYSLQAEQEIWDDIARPSDEEEDQVLVTCPHCGVEHRVWAEVEDLSCDDCHQERRDLLAEEREATADLWVMDEDDLPW
jgi:hypothetical protein